MVLAIQYVVDPYLPEEFNTLYQSIVSEDGKWRFPKGAFVEGPPDGWDIEFTAPNRYTLAHYLNSPVSIQITLRNVGAQYNIVDLHSNFVTIDTFDAEGKPAPTEWKFALRKVHLISPEASA